MLPSVLVEFQHYRRLTGRPSLSEDLLEVDFSGGSVTAVGDQFGIGRVTP